MSYTLVNNAVDIDLTRHALIEASAGTGKTYTLENLVVRLLKERPDIAIENILMVTFTEKATSELKTRIQAKLVQEIQAVAKDQDAQGIVRKLRDTLDAFDTAPIYTIHGFCHAVLKDFAFENQTLFQNEVIDDGPVFDALIKEQMRKIWPEVYGAHLSEMLYVSKFSARKDRFLDLVVSIARRVYRGDVGDTMRPDTQGQSIDQIRSAVITRVMALKSLIGDPPALAHGFEQLNINARSKKSLLAKIVVPLETYLARIDAQGFTLNALVELIDLIKAVKSAGRQGIECLVPEKWTKKGNNIQVCPNLETLTRGLKDLAVVLDQMTCYLAINAVKQLQQDVVRTKRQNGWISFDDMLSQVASAVDSDDSTGLLDTLRRKYKVAFVDEFQDTDPVQWRIFQRLFLGQKARSDQNILVLIGDPKQAIYAFRGADVYAYLEARNVMARMAQAGEARLYYLATNWRSKPELVGTFNELFAQKEWFPPHEQAGPFTIGYQGAGSPDENQLPALITGDRSRRKVFNVVDLRQAATPKRAKPILARFIATEIRYLVDHGGITIQVPDHEARDLDFGDICILVRGKPDAVYLEAQLTEFDIPYSFYKKPGLFLSDEALYLSLVCHAVMDPGSIADVKKGLLTPFFTYEPTDLYAYETLPEGHPLKQLLFYWHDLAHERKWGRLFQSFMEDSGLLFRETPSRDWERKYTNLRQIFEHLEAVAYRNNLDFRGLSALLDSYRKQTIGAEDEADIHQIETETQKVQIMTMHVSKGLQFPVVFVAGGLTQPVGDAYHLYHDFDPDNPEAGSHKVIDLSKTCNKAQHDREKDDEDKRLYYVALTRAQFKLYVPFWPATQKHAWLGPVCRFLSKAIEAAFSRTGEHPALGWLDPDDPAGIGPDTDQTPRQADVGTSSGAKIPLGLPTNDNYQARKIMLESFSSVQRRIHLGLEQTTRETRFLVLQNKAKEDDEHMAVADSGHFQAVRTDSEIPGGADIGSMFHDILEHIDFESVARNPDGLFVETKSRDLVVKTMDAYQVDSRWQPQVCQMLANTLTAPIQVLADAFVLGQLKKEDRLHEVEFYYPLVLASDKPVKIPDCEVVGGSRCFLRGFVDLVFRYKEKYYIADWKSNRLENGYGRKALDACMNDAGYHLQYKLYTVAVLRWLQRVFGDRFHADRHFGGVFYFFLRGMGAGNGKGVYYVAPGDIGPLAQLESEITAQIATHAHPSL